MSAASGDRRAPEEIYRRRRRVMRKTGRNVADRDIGCSPTTCCSKANGASKYRSTANISCVPVFDESDFEPFDAASRSQQQSAWLVGCVEPEFKQCSEVGAANAASADGKSKGDVMAHGIETRPRNATMTTPSRGTAWRRCRKMASRFITSGRARVFAQYIDKRNIDSALCCQPIRPAAIRSST